MHKRIQECKFAANAPFPTGEPLRDRSHHVGAKSLSTAGLGGARVEKRFRISDSNTSGDLGRPNYLPCGNTGTTKAAIVDALTFCNPSFNIC